MLLDSASLYFRAFYGVPDTVRAPDGTPVNAATGFLEMVATVIAAAAPTRLVACLDLDWRPAFRVAAIPRYKAHRLAPNGAAENIPPLLQVQVPIILDVLAAIGIARAGADGYEADDVLGALAAAETDDPVEVVSGDRDMFQVVRDEPTPVRVRYIGRGVARAQLYGPTELATRYGLPRHRAGAAYVDLAVLRGDPSDGLPGVPGIGEKTAAAVVSRFDSFDELLTAVDDPTDTRLSTGVRLRMAAARDYLTAAPAVVRAALDAPVLRSGPDPLPTTPEDPDTLADLATRWNLHEPLARLTATLARRRP
jgi:5'-3' exonuclease